jgi:hypothetical protein
MSYVLEVSIGACTFDPTKFKPKSDVHHYGVQYAVNGN